MHKIFLFFSVFIYFAIALYGLALYVVARPALVGFLFAVMSVILICALHRSGWSN